jgi:hypothetical protein
MRAELYTRLTQQASSLALTGIGTTRLNRVGTSRIARFRKKVVLFYRVSMLDPSSTEEERALVPRIAGQTCNKGHMLHGLMTLPFRLKAVRSRPFASKRWKIRW